MEHLYNFDVEFIARARIEIQGSIDVQQIPAGVRPFCAVRLIDLPEVVAAYPEIELNAVENAAGENEDARSVVSTRAGKSQVITYTAGSEMRPFMRYRIAKSMADYFLTEKLNEMATDANEFTSHLRDVQSNLFAAKLLAPAHLIKKEMARINVSKDVVSQLAEIFWVSKTFMNRRLKELLQGAFEA